jgi:ribosomal protein S18 acetylase RimI-like enzyme
LFFIRTVTDEDLPRVSRLLGETWHATYDGIYGVAKVSELTSRWHSVAALKVRFMRPQSEFVVADDGKRIAGMGYAAMADDLAETVMLRQLYVHPHHQGQGVGRDMFAELETCFPNARRLRLEVEPKNEGAIRFYTGLGMVEVGRTANCGQDQSGIPALIMEKTLAG